MRRDGERGFVMVIVLGVLVLLTALTLGFARRAMLERRAAAMSMEHTIALSYARGAAQRGIADLRNRTVLEGLGKQGAKGGGPTWRDHPDPVEEKLYTAKDMDEKDKIDYIVEDLDGRISMNLGQADMLEEIEFLNFMTVAQIIDRRGTSNGKRPATPFLVTEEVLTLKDMDDEDWYGKNGKPGVRDLLTAWGDKTINLNTAPREVIAAVPGIDRGLVDTLYRYRCGRDGKPDTDDDQFFSNMEDLQAACDVSTSQMGVLLRYCKLNSRFFTITGLATRLQGKVRAYCTATIEMRGKDAKVLQWREGPVDF